MTYSEDELRRKLQELGDSPGPINAANKLALQPKG